jgi:hypothetical protein
LTKKIQNERILTNEELKILGISQDIPNSDDRGQVTISVKINIHYYLIGFQDITHYDIGEEIFVQGTEGQFPHRNNEFQKADTVIKILSGSDHSEQETTSKISKVTQLENLQKNKEL